MLALIVVGYLLGSIPAAVIVSRLRGIDIHRVGSGVAGTTNVRRHVGLVPAVVVAVVDLGKGALAVLVPLWLDAGPLIAVLAGLAALVGHAWPVWTGFRGGLSAASGVGMTAALLPVPSLLAVPLAVAAIVIARRPAPAATAIYLGAVVFGAVLGAEPVRVVGVAVAGVFVLVRTRAWER